MCGRFTLVTTAQDLAQQFEIEIDRSITSRYNIAPSQAIFSIRNEANQRIIDLMQWGLIPNWVKDLNSWKSNLINARAETVSEKPSFRGAFKYRPCLIPASGFYEWTKSLSELPTAPHASLKDTPLDKAGSHRKQPYYYQLKDRPLFAFAGLWESWSNGEDELVTCTIITTEANKEAAKVHHRMPVIIQSTDYDSWLGKSDDRKRLLDALPKVDLELYPVSKLVNSPKNDTSECIRAATPKAFKLD